MSVAIGQQAEASVLDYLTKQGLKLVSRNFYCRFGEIDLIMQEQHCLVFLEIRKRSSSTYGGALMSVTKSKQRKIILSAQYYLSVSHIKYNMPIRFDVVGVEGASSQLVWIKNAFGC